MRMRTVWVPSTPWGTIIANALNDGFAKIERILNWVTFADNISSELCEVTAPSSADTEFTVTHILNNEITHVWIVDADRAAIIYRSQSTWSNGTTDTIYLKCNVADAQLKICIAV